MKLHYSIHVAMLAAIVYLSAQLTTTKQNNVEVKDQPRTYTQNVSGDNSKLENLNSRLQKLNEENQLLLKGKEVADDKIKDLKNELKALITENDDLKKRVHELNTDQKRTLAQNKDPLKNVRDFIKQAKLNPKKNLHKFYTPLFDQLNLSEEERKEFIDLMMGPNSGSSKYVMINGVPLINSNKPISDELKNFLGNDLPAYERYKKTAIERGQINTMNNSLSEDNKLTADASEALIDLLHERKEQKANGNALSDEEYLEQSANFLNEEQNEAFKKQLKSPMTLINSRSITIK